MSSKRTKRILAVIIVPIGILCSCGTVKLNGYKAIKASSIQEERTENFNDCSGKTTYYYSNSGKVLDGKFQINYANRKYCFVELDSGLLVNEYVEYYGKNISIQENYKNGLRDGTSIHYEELKSKSHTSPRRRKITVQYINGVLNGPYTFVEDAVVKKTGTYTNGVKSDMEYWFDPEGDTVKTLLFKQELTTTLPAVLDNVELKENYNYLGKVQVIGLILKNSERTIFFADLAGMYTDFMCKEMLLVEDLFENRFLLLFKQDILVEIIEL